MTSKETEVSATIEFDPTRLDIKSDNVLTNLINIVSNGIDRAIKLKSKTDKVKIQKIGKLKTVFTDSALTGIQKVRVTK